MEPRWLIYAAFHARKRAYAPYSRFAVGAALLAENDSVTLGCNVENAALTPGSCAERSALYAAVSGGVRRIRAIAVVGGRQDAEDSPALCPPCGVCRQALREFCDPRRLRVYLAPLACLDDIRCLTLEELLPLSFGAAHTEGAETP